VDLKAMRRVCAALVEDLHLPVPTSADQLISALCNRMGARLGKPVNHQLVSFPPDTVTGLWFATESAHFVLCEQQTSPWHRMLITGHEFWHMLAEQDSTPVLDNEVMQRLFPSLEPQALARILAARSHCTGPHEREAELFASLLLASVSRCLPKATWAPPAHAASLVGRLEVSLGCQADRRHRG
jgi:hypothetical protein